MNAQHINKHKVRRAFDRAAAGYDEAAVLQQEVCSRLLQRLDYIRLSPEWILDAGAGTGEAVKALMDKYRKARLLVLDISEQMLAKSAAQGGLLRKPYPVCADIEQLPLADASIDLVFSSLTLQWCNDLEATFKGIRRIMKPGGLFMFASFGPDTLKELRACWSRVDNAVHVNTFEDMHDVGDALLRTGFADPVMESEIITVNYATVDRLMADLRGIGANVTADGGRRGLTTKTMLAQLREAYEAYRRDDVLPASYEIIYGHAWNIGADSAPQQSVNVDFLK
jgi:malonyl-CoA O-methyltransferase